MIDGNGRSMQLFVVAMSDGLRERSSMVVSLVGARGSSGFVKPIMAMRRTTNIAAVALATSWLNEAMIVHECMNVGIDATVDATEGRVFEFR